MEKTPNQKDQKNSLPFADIVGFGFKFGQGLVGKSATIVVCIVAFATIISGGFIWVGKPEYVLLIFFTTIIAAAIWFWRCEGIWKEDKQAGFVDGQELRILKEAQLKAKMMPPVIDVAPDTNPENPITTALSNQQTSRQEGEKQ